MANFWAVFATGRSYNSIVKEESILYFALLSVFLKSIQVHVFKVCENKI